MIPTIGILGGTFDPIHYGHLRFASAVRSALGLTKVHVIPAGVPPHREAPWASPQDRMAMTKLGCAEFPSLQPDDREVGRAGPSYTVDTLQELHSEDRNRPLALLLGTDALQGLASWHRWQQLFTLAHIVVVERPGTLFDVAALAPPLLYRPRLSNRGHAGDCVPTDRGSLSTTATCAQLDTRRARDDTPGGFRRRQAC